MPVLWYTCHTDYRLSLLQNEQALLSPASCNEKEITAPGIVKTQQTSVFRVMRL
ncbi:MAG: hypothetical protein AB2L24_15775 [Mangrovibacterium sp.]